jgi:hypothetical protein
MSLRVVSANVRGLSSCDKRRAVFGWLKRLSAGNGSGSAEQWPAVVLLQETHVGPDTDPRPWAREVGPMFYSFFSRARDAAAGVGILVRRDLVCACELEAEDRAGRWMLVRARFHEPGLGEVLLMSVYAPASGSQDRRTFLANSFPWSRLRGQRVLCGGDWNCTLLDGDRIVQSGLQPPAVDHEDKLKPDAQKLARLLARYGLRDALQLLGRAPDAAHATFLWHRTVPDALLIRSRLDRFYLSGDLQLHVEGLRTLLTGLSDHRWVELRLRPEAEACQRGPGLRRFDAALCSRPDVTKRIEELAAAWVAQAPDPEAAHDDEFRDFDALSWWERLTDELRDQLQTFDTMHRVLRQAEVEEARAAEAEAQRAVEADASDREAHARLTEARRTLRRVESEWLARARVRAARRWYHHWERPSRQFFRVMQLRRRDRNCIRQLREARDPSKEALLEAAARFYRDLYAERDISEEALQQLLATCQRRLSAEARAMLDKPLGPRELLEAARSMRHNKAPGCDGLPAELFQSCPSLVTAIAIMWRGALLAQRLPPRQCTAAITLLFKNKGDRDTLVNYRPVAQLNVARKILAKAYVRRLNGVLAQVVGPEQTGFVPGRDIRNNILQAHLAYRLAERDGLEGAIAFYDFEKAYDRLSRRYLLRVLEHMGFGPAFCDAVRVLQAESLAFVLVNGFHSELFPMRSGVP